MCGINQLSPGAYLLRGDLFPAIIAVCVHCLSLVLGLTETSDDQGTGNGEIHLRSVAPTCTAIQFSQVGCGQAQPLSPSHWRNYRCSGVAQGVLGSRVRCRGNCEVGAFATAFLKSLLMRPCIQSIPRNLRRLSTDHVFDDRFIHDVAAPRPGFLLHPSQHAEGAF